MQAVALKKFRESKNPDIAIVAHDDAIRWSFIHSSKFPQYAPDDIEDEHSSCMMDQETNKRNKPTTKPVLIVRKKSRTKDESLESGNEAVRGNHWRTYDSAELKRFACEFSQELKTNAIQNRRDDTDFVKKDSDAALKMVHEMNEIRSSTRNKHVCADRAFVVSSVKPSIQFMSLGVEIPRFDLRKFAQKNSQG